jgi:2-oxoglutarate ferredoxin oxidoreductase subunit beta
MLLQALRTQIAAAGFSFVEILTMCPTGWFIETQEAPGYLADNLAAVHTGGVLKDVLGSPPLPGPAQEGS